ncbi:marginal zone B- and B1-cell-specific protein [Tachyglossus aculeatus]|uniref:marginal zone B- and B1-cell-specific protein n=1 Tax=Tachyglossus aculeatus TaxID=9261 RepID=UPI0018F708AD|nr:marginal zone B- and B1-cell-specific protein [Tachyglossus aculeatus]
MGSQPGQLALWLLAFCLILGGRTRGVRGGEDPQEPPTLSATSPELDDEETHSGHMPGHLRCDACRAIAFQMKDHLTRAEEKRSSRRRGEAELSESEYTDVLESSCSQRWQYYGVQQVDKVKRLTGPGLDSRPGVSVMVTGGPWPARLFKMCQQYLGELGEEQIYQEHRRGPGALETLLCQAPGAACASPGPDHRPLHAHHPKSHREL